MGLTLGLVAANGQREPRSKPWRVDRLRIPEIERIAERLGCFDLTDHMPRARHLFLSHVMTYGTIEEVVAVEKHFSEDEFVQALRWAPPGIFDKYSWNYWNLKFDRVPVPPLPRRRFLKEATLKTDH